MIISHKHKFIFIRTHKTASSSFEMALRYICGPEDVITQLQEDKIGKKDPDYRVAQHYYIPFSFYTIKDWFKFLVTFRRLKFIHHNSAQIVKDHIPNKIWNSYFKFCFDRNPYDKVISWYYWNKRKTNYDFETYLVKCKEQLEKEASTYYINGELAVDKVYPYEKLEESLKDISDKLKLSEPLKMPNYKAKSNIREDRRPYQEVLDKNQMEKIYNIFSKVFDLLGYEK